MAIISRTLTTDSSGDDTEIIDFHGTINTISIDYAADAASGTDVTVTGHIGSKSFTIYTKSNSNTDAIVRPRTPVDDNAGTNVTFDGSNEIYEPFMVDKLTLTVAQGGDTKQVRFDILGQRVMEG